MSAPIVQTNNAKFVSIIPENGTEFQEGQKIIFNLDPALGYIKARDSYLCFDIQNTSSASIKYTLANAGISSIIKQVNIYSKQNGMLLETLDNYNKWVACEASYRFDDTSNLTALEGFPESIHADGVGSLGGGAGQETYVKNGRNTYGDATSHRLSPSDDTGNTRFAPVRFMTPLRCGIFRHWDDEVLVPILMMGGLRIELILAPSREVLDIPYTGKDFQDGGGFHISEGILGDGAGSALKCPIDNFLATATEVDITLGPFGAGHQRSGFCLGQSVNIAGTGLGAGGINRTITGIRTDNFITKITLNAATGVAVADGSAKMCILSTTIANDLAQKAYKIVNAEFKLLQEMPPNNQMKNIDYTFTSYDLFRTTIPKTQLNFNQDIQSVASKAVSLFTRYEDPNYNTDTLFPHTQYYEGTNPDKGINLNSIVYFINNKMYPLSAYNPSAGADKIINQNEVVKAFGTLGIAVKNLGSAQYFDLNGYTNRYLHARELARGNSVFDLQNAEPQIRLGFSAARATDDLNRTINNVNMETLVFSKKILKIDGDTGLTLIH